MTGSLHNDFRSLLLLTNDLWETWQLKREVGSTKCELMTKRSELMVERELQFNRNDSAQKSNKKETRFQLLLLLPKNSKCLKSYNKCRNLRVGLKTPPSSIKVIFSFKLLILLKRLHHWRSFPLHTIPKIHILSLIF